MTNLSALIKPPLLKQGDRIAVVSPSWGGPGTFPHRYQAGKRQLIEALGVDVVEMPHALADADWIARNPKARADDIMQAFSDPSIDGIIASIGGDDSIRLIPHIDLSVIRNNPKIFMGFSDTTVMHFGCMKAGLGSFYGPSVMAGFGENCGPRDYMIQSVKRALFMPEPMGDIEPSREGWTVEHLDWADPANQTRRRTLNPFTGPQLLQGTGSATGHLMGGCAEVMDMINGSPWWPSLDAWRGAILFYETSEDAPDPKFIKYWMRNLAAQGILQVLNGILLARPGGQIEIAKHGEYGKAIIGVLHEEGLTDMPVLANLDFGHTDPIFTLPYGVQAEIDCATTSLRILESGVTPKPALQFPQARPPQTRSHPPISRE
jgi:muramoyltetrapeptide carboxypeptidase LdcA involved in peptidoglycan recycling